MNNVPLTPGNKMSPQLPTRLESFYGKATTAVLSGLAALTLVGCSRSDPSTTPVVNAEWVHHGEGVYTFRHGDNVGEKLAAFKKEHKDLVITSTYSDKETGHGMTLRVVIVTEPRAQLSAPLHANTQQIYR